jgi:hypothetical protein
VHKCDVQLPDGRKPAAHLAGWTAWYCELVGAILVLWPCIPPLQPTAEYIDQVKLGKASHVNVTDCDVQTGVETISGGRAGVFALNTAGCNLYHLQAAPGELVRWISGIRLACFEASKLHEIYTAALLKRPQFLPAVIPMLDKFSAYVQVRYSGCSEWKLLWCVVSKDGASKSTGLLKKKDKAPELERRGQVLFYETKKSKKPMLTLCNVYQAYAIYPERPQLVDLSMLCKIEGTVFQEQPNPASPVRSPTYCLIMANSPQEMVSFLFSTMSLFKLYNLDLNLPSSFSSRGSLKKPSSSGQLSGQQPASISATLPPSFSELYLTPRETIERVPVTGDHLDTRTRFEQILAEKVTSKRLPESRGGSASSSPRIHKAQALPKGMGRNSSDESSEESCSASSDDSSDGITPQNRRMSDMKKTSPLVSRPASARNTIAGEVVRNKPSPSDVSPQLSKLQIDSSKRASESMFSPSRLVNSNKNSPKGSPNLHKSPVVTTSSRNSPTAKVSSATPKNSTPSSPAVASKSTTDVETGSEDSEDSEEDSEEDSVSGSDSESESGSGSSSGSEEDSESGSGSESGSDSGSETGSGTGSSSEGSSSDSDPVLARSNQADSTKSQSFMLDPNAVDFMAGLPPGMRNTGMNSQSFMSPRAPEFQPNTLLTNPYAQASNREAEEPLVPQFVQFGGLLGRPKQSRLAAHQELQRRQQYYAQLQEHQQQQQMGAQLRQQEQYALNSLNQRPRGPLLSVNPREREREGSGLLSVVTSRERNRAQQRMMHGGFPSGSGVAELVERGAGTGKALSLDFEKDRERIMALEQRQMAKEMAEERQRFDEMMQVKREQQRQQMMMEQQQMMYDPQRMTMGGPSALPSPRQSRMSQGKPPNRSSMYGMGMTPMMMNMPKTAKAPHANMPPIRLPSGSSDDSDSDSEPVGASRAHGKGNPTSGDESDSDVHSESDEDDGRPLSRAKGKAIAQRKSPAAAQSSSDNSDKDSSSEEEQRKPAKGSKKKGKGRDSLNSPMAQNPMAAAAYQQMMFGMMPPMGNMAMHPAFQMQMQQMQQQMQQMQQMQHMAGNQNMPGFPGMNPNMYGMMSPMMPQMPGNYNMPTDKSSKRTSKTNKESAKSSIPSVSSKSESRSSPRLSEPPMAKKEGKSNGKKNKPKS